MIDPIFYVPQGLGEIRVVIHPGLGHVSSIDGHGPIVLLSGVPGTGSAAGGPTTARGAIFSDTGIGGCETYDTSYPHKEIIGDVSLFPFDECIV